MRPDTCLDCEHFYFEPACHGYSDMTPGWDMRIGCYKDHWELDRYEDTTVRVLQFYNFWLILPDIITK